MKKLFVILILLIIPSICCAQTKANSGDTVIWDHDGVNTTEYQVSWDLRTNVDGAVIWESTEQNKFVKIPALTPGLHTVYVRPCNGPTNCADTNSLQFMMIAILPRAVTNVRIASGINTATPATAKIPLLQPSTTTKKPNSIKK